jgi:Domain of unknown function (DUF4111)
MKQRPRRPPSSHPCYRFPSGFRNTFKRHPLLQTSSPLKINRELTLGLEQRTGAHQVRSAHDDSLVVYWSLRERGITLIGPEPRTFVAPVPGEDLRQAVLDTMRSWREQLLKNPSDLDNRFYQPFAVLSYCRMLHTLECATVESKRAGSMWAKAALDSRWHQLIRRAWDARLGEPAVKVR